MTTEDVGQLLELLRASDTEAFRQFDRLLSLYEELNRVAGLAGLIIEERRPRQQAKTDRKEARP